MPEPQTCNFVEKETLAQVFPCEFYEISRNTFFTGHVWETACLYLQLQITSTNYAKIITNCIKNFREIRKQIYFSSASLAAIHSSFY